LKKCLTVLADGDWWHTIIDYAHPVYVERNITTAELSILNCESRWKPNIALDEMDRFVALLELSLHGFGGGGARGTELGRPSMFHTVWHNGTLYYGCESIKVFNSTVIKFKEVERKLPPCIARYYLLFRHLVNSHTVHFELDYLKMLPKLNGSNVNAANLIKEIFTLPSAPDMTQVRQFWASVLNNTTGGVSVLTSTEIGAAKMGHTAGTHLKSYSNQIEVSEDHYNLYHSAIGDLSHSWKYTSDKLTIEDISKAMRLRYPQADVTKSCYLTCQQKELIQFGYHAGSVPSHCVGLLAPGEGKSECYLVPTLARKLSKKDDKTIIYVSPYNFLAAFQDAKARRSFSYPAVFSSLGIRTFLFQGSDFQDGTFPDVLESPHDLPDILFMNLDAISNLLEFHKPVVMSWVSLKRLDRIVLDEVHTMISESCFRDKYRVYQLLPSVGVPIIALSGSIPTFLITRFLHKLCLSTKEDLSDVKIIRGTDIIGNFPPGFTFDVVVDTNPIRLILRFAMGCLGTGPDYPTSAIHLFASTVSYAQALYNGLKDRYSCRLVTGETEFCDIAITADDWINGKFTVLVSTSIALVGVENPKCKFLGCAGCFYDCTQMVQFFGRLRNYQRKVDGKILMVVPPSLSHHMVVSDNNRITHLKHAGYYSTIAELELMTSTMSLAGVHQWSLTAKEGNQCCSLQDLSSRFGYTRGDCGVCKYCRSCPINSTKVQAVARQANDNKHAAVATRVLTKLSYHCVCRKNGCDGVPLWNKSAKHCLPHLGSCFDCIFNNCKRGTCTLHASK
jgi:hypothetical protein